jgi:hypothetical protein
MTELELILTVTTLLSLLGIVFAMVESNQQKRRANALSAAVDGANLHRGSLAKAVDELKGISETKDKIIDSLLEQRDAAETKAIELTQLLNNNQEYILALEDKAIAKKASEKKAKAPAKKATPKKSKKG